MTQYNTVSAYNEVKTCRAFSLLASESSFYLAKPTIKYCPLIRLAQEYTKGRVSTIDLLSKGPLISLAEEC